jgi:hypothetical protein
VTNLPDELYVDFSDKPQAETATPAKPGLFPAFRAAYPGRCESDDCVDGIIRIGDWIRREGDGYVHQNCEEEQRRHYQFQGTSLKDMGY